MAKKYTNLGAYTRPTQDDKDFAAKNGWKEPTKAYVKVNLPEGQQVTIKSGDRIFVTKREDKLKQINENKASMSDKQFNFLVNLYSNEDTIGELTIAQNE